MSRRILLTMMALGVLITTVGFGGIYAVFTDRATTGETGGTSAELPGAVDIRIARSLAAAVCDPGDESAAGDGTCASGAPGELKSVLYLSARRYDCATGAGVGSINEAYVNQAATVSTPILGIGDVLASGGIACLRITTLYPDYDNGTTTTEAQLAQSDRISWRFAFDATES